MDITIESVIFAALAAQQHGAFFQIQASPLQIQAAGLKSTCGNHHSAFCSISCINCCLNSRCLCIFCSCCCAEIQNIELVYHMVSPPKPDSFSAWFSEDRPRRTKRTGAGCIKDSVYSAVVPLAISRTSGLASRYSLNCLRYSSR